MDTVENRLVGSFTETCVTCPTYVDLPDRPYSQVPGVCVTRFSVDGAKREVSWLLSDFSFRTGRWPGKQYWDTIEDGDGSPPYYTISRTVWYWDDGKTVKRVMTYRGKQDGCRGMPGIEEIIDYDIDGLLLLHMFTLKGTFTTHEAHFRAADEIGEDGVLVGKKGDKLGETVIYL